MDISADLIELGRTPVAVVSSGFKSFLDIQKSLEFLETQGVCVSTFADGRSGAMDFPGFWSRESGIPSPSTLINERQAASTIQASHQLCRQTGMLLANPIPLEWEVPRSKLSEMEVQAVQETKAQGIKGNQVTPFILSRISMMSAGASSRANEKLAEANVIRAAKIATELQQLESQGRRETRTR